MQREALFLGTGASKVFGLPLTNEIFPEIVHRLKENSLFDDSEEIKVLSTFIRRLLPGLSDLSNENYPLITDILSLMDHLVANGNTLWKKTILNDLENFRILFERGIFEVLKVPFHNTKLADNKDKPEILNSFIDWIYRSINYKYFTIISTNNDLVVEHELYDKFIDDKETLSKAIDFGIKWRHPVTNKIVLQPNKPKLGIYKLHGSTNWLKCNLCNHIYINTSGSISHQAFRKKIDGNNTFECGHAPLSSFIVAPSLERVIHDNNIPYLWNNALEQMRTSEEWIIMGYSFPPEDINIKSLFVRAFRGRKTKPKITIVPQGESAQPRYTSIFGKINYNPSGLEGFLRDKMTN